MTTTTPPDTSQKFNVKELLQSNLREYGMIVALVVIVAFFQWSTGGILLTPLNITNIVLQNSYTVIMALGMLLVIVCFHIDLSVGSVAAFIGATAGSLIVNSGLNWALACALCLALGAAIGVWHGYWIAYQGIPSFIVTLASMLLFRGLTLQVIGNTGTIGPLPTGFNRIAAGFIGDPLGSGAEGSRHVLTIVLGFVLSAILVGIDWRGRANLVRHGFTPSPFSIFVAKNVVLAGVLIWLSWTMAGFQGYPNALVLLAVLVAVYAVITTRTVVGRRIYATGGNAAAAKLSGVQPKKMVMLTFANMGFLSALGGLVLTARLNSATPKAGEGLELDVIAAVFIGGASAAGGKGRVAGTVIGAFIMGILNNGMSLKGVDIGWQRVIKGLVLLLAVWFDIFNKRRSEAG